MHLTSILDLNPPTFFCPSPKRQGCKGNKASAVTNGKDWEGKKWQPLDYSIQVDRVHTRPCFAVFVARTSFMRALKICC